MGKYDRIMKKCERFYNSPKVEEVYNLNCSMVDFLIPRLEIFLKESTKIVDWEWHKEHDHIYIEHDIRQVIRKLKYIQQNSYSSDADILRRCKRYSEEVYDKLKELHFWLWY